MFKMGKKWQISQARPSNRPDYTETVSYTSSQFHSDSDELDGAFGVVPMKSSKFIKNRMIEDKSKAYTRCPRCGDKGPYLEHGQKAVCGSCSLNMELFGIGLTIYENT